MIRFFVYFFEIIICYILQSSVFSYMRISGIVPDILLILIICVSYNTGQKKGMAVGFFSGLLLDLLFSNAIGISSLIYVFIGFISGYVHIIHKKADFVIPSIMIIFGEFFYSLLYYITYFFLQGRLEFGLYLVHTILPRTLYTFLTAIIIYPLLLIIESKISDFEG